MQTMAKFALIYNKWVKYAGEITPNSERGLKPTTNPTHSELLVNMYVSDARRREFQENGWIILEWIT